MQNKYPRNMRAQDFYDHEQRISRLERKSNVETKLLFIAIFATILLMVATLVATHKSDLACEQAKQYLEMSEMESYYGQQ